MNARCQALRACPPPGDMRRSDADMPAKMGVKGKLAAGHVMMMTGHWLPDGTCSLRAFPACESFERRAGRRPVTSFVRCRHFERIRDKRRSTFEAAPRRPPHWWVEAGLANQTSPARASRGILFLGETNLLGAYAAGTANCFGIRICRDFPEQKGYILSGRRFN